MKLWAPGKPLEHGLRVRLAASDAFTREESAEGDGDIIVEGWFTTEKLNSYGQIVLAESFNWDGGLKVFNGRVMGFHEMRKEPIGVVENMRIVKGKGLWGRVRIFVQAPELLKRGIREGVLNAFSIGFDVEEYSYDEKKVVVTFLRSVLLEVTVCNIGANEEALFSVVQNQLAEMPDLSTDTDIFESENRTIINTRIGGKKIMANDKMIEPGLLTLDKYETEKANLQANIDEVMHLQHELNTEVQNLRTGTVTKPDFMAKVEKMATDFQELATKVEAGQNSERLGTERFVSTDYRQLLGSYDWLNHDDGRKYNDLDYRAHALFQMPVNYDKFEMGQELQNLRNLHDAVKCVDAFYIFNSGNRGGKRYRIEDTKIWKQFVAAVRPFDSTLANAMATGNTGFGAEWVPQEMSSEFNEYLRVQPVLPNKFETWMMPVGGSANYPFQNGKAKAYKGGEALVDNAAQFRKTNIATKAKLFTPKLFCGALIGSDILTEDSILDMVALIRKELAVAILEGLESAIINGDDTATHMDEAHAQGFWASYDLETAFQGLRHLADAGTATFDAETPSGATGVKALAIKGLVVCKEYLGVAGLRPSDCLFVTGIKGRAQIQNALFKEDALGVLQYIITGMLPPIDGTEVYVSGMYLEDLDDDGFGAATKGSGKHTSICCAHKPSFRIGQRRGVTLEMAKEILTGQQQFVATARYDFGKICADAIDPVSAAINVQHTA